MNENDLPPGQYLDDFAGRPCSHGVVIGQCMWCLRDELEFEQRCIEEIVAAVEKGQKD